MDNEFRTHGDESAVDDEVIRATPLENARHAVAQRFPNAADAIYRGEWDRGPWIEKAIRAASE